MLKICLVFWKSEPQYAYKRYAHKKKTCNKRLLKKPTRQEKWNHKNSTITYQWKIFETP